MPTIVTITGCPSPTSRATAILHYAHRILAKAEIDAEMINLRHLPSTDLLLGIGYSTPIQQSKRMIAQADGLIIATAICNGAYNGGLKAFFDLLPPAAFRNKTILPIALGASAVDFPAVDQALRTVLKVLGANQVLEGAYLIEREVKLHDRQTYLEPAAQPRIDQGYSHPVADYCPQTSCVTLWPHSAKTSLCRLKNRPATSAECGRLIYR